MAAPGQSDEWRRPFTIFVVGQFVSYVGDALALIALPLLVLETTDSVARMGLMTGLTGVGGLIGSVAAGQLADRFDRRALMLWCDVARMVVFAVVPVFWALGLAHVAVLYVVGGFAGLLAACFMVTQLAALPRLVPREQLTMANGRLVAAYGTAMFLGPLLAGLSCARVGAAATLGFDVATFAVSAVSLLLVRFRPAETHAGAGDADDRSLRPLGSLRFLWRQPTLRFVLVLVSLSFMLLAGAHDLLIFHLTRDLGESEQTVGFVFGIASVGAIQGGALAPVLRRRFGLAATFLGALVLQGVCVALLGASATAYAAAGATLGFAFANSTVRLFSVVLRQELTPDHLLGRVTATFWVVTATVEPLGAAAAGLVAERAGAPSVLVALGAVAATIGLAGGLMPAPATGESLTS